MMKLIVVSALICLPIYNIFAQESNSVQVLVGTHVVLPGETLYSLSKKYSTKVDDILQINPEIVDYNLSVGKLLKVPVISRRADQATIPETAILHQALKQETLYSISKRNNTDVASIMRWNNLFEPAIKEGQWLIVGFTSSKINIPDRPLSNAAPTASKDSGNSNARIFNGDSEMPPAASSTSKEILDSTTDTVAAAFSAMGFLERGIATWVRSESDNGNFYALHASAEIGTEMKVKNLMNRKIVTVKVIGKVPATSVNENVLIKLSASAAKTLGVLDEKFLVELAYNKSEYDKEKLDSR
jgi:LysM repeat protein